jgi:hypothetical protein
MKAFCQYVNSRDDLFTSTSARFSIQEPERVPHGVHLNLSNSLTTTLDEYLLWYKLSISRDHSCDLIDIHLLRFFLHTIFLAWWPR